MKKKANTSNTIWNAVMSPRGLVSISRGPRKKYRRLLKRPDRFMLSIKVTEEINHLVTSINRTAEMSEAAAMILFEQFFCERGWEPISFATGDRQQDEEIRQLIEEETGIQVVL